MADRQPVILRRHRLAHLGSIRVSDDLFTRQFASGCSMTNCNAACCQDGVMVGPGERNRILAHAELIQRYMEPHQDKDPAGWFDDDEEVDTDFPEGRAVGTQVRTYGCVFLDSAGRCTLQKTAAAEGMGKFALKPFFCVAFPLTIEDGVLMVDNPDFTGRTQCCSTAEGGELSVFDVCEEELEFMLGEAGLNELKSHLS